MVRAGIFLIFLLGLVLPADASIPPERFARDSDFRVISEKVTGLKAPPVAYVPRPALFSYDGDSLPVGARMLGAPDLSVRYDRNGLPSEIRMGELSETFTYSSLGELEAHRALFGGSLLWSEEFPNSGGRDKLGRILQKIERYQPLGTSEDIDQTFYRYDLAGRLTEEKSRYISSTAPGPYLVRTYQYDASGNRVMDREGSSPGCTKTYSYDAQDRLLYRSEEVCFDPRDTGWQGIAGVPVLISDRGTAYGFGRAGDLMWKTFFTRDRGESGAVDPSAGPWLAGESETVSYDVQGRLETAVVNLQKFSRDVHASGSLRQEYSWDARGHVSSIRNGYLVPRYHNFYVWSGERLVAQGRHWDQGLDADQPFGPILTHRFVYLPGERVPEYVLISGRDVWSPDGEDHIYKIITDERGSVIQLIDAESGYAAQENTYDAFGRLMSSTNPFIQPIGFAGGFTLLGPNLVRFGARDYDPETGRWTSKDPIGFGGGDTSLYGYVLGDPINWTDFSGSAQFGMRPLDGVPVAIGEEGSPADQDNLEIAHEQLFFDDQTSPDNLGFFNDGEVRPDNPKKHEKSDYEMRDPVYDDKIMRDAVKNVNAGEYDVLSNNCQDWADAVRREYERLKKLEKEKEKDKKRLVCPKS